MAFFDWLPSRAPLRRIRTDIDERWKITAYGGDNLYPQKMHQILLRSPLIKKSVSILSDFINGDGFSTNTEEPVNDFGQNINDILLSATNDLAEYDGFSLLLNLNGLGQAETVENIPFQFVRFGLPDTLGRHRDVKISNNWEQYSGELPQGSQINVEGSTFPLWNPLTNTENGMKSQAVVLYYTGGTSIHDYPLVTFDAITNAGQSDADIQQFELNSIANGFHGLTLFRYPGQFEGDEEKAALYNKITEMQGVGGNGIFIVEVDEDVGPILENVPANNTDSLYLNTIGHIQDTITQNYGMPGVLLGITNTGSVFNEQALIDAFIIFNTKTKNSRNIVARLFNSFGTFGDIIPQTILKDETIDDGEQETEEVEEEVEEESIEENDEDTNETEAA